MAELLQRFCDEGRGFVMKEDSWRTIRGSTNYKCADGSKNGFAPV